ncbi:AMP-binding protein [Bradyrhizobium sp. JYMT SZCCT0428]|uniref:AMP-binding protein n=1 Tax=Bradyrhizobium sp. JYMT SZCCT0428 TaxID=2807673 RepID=UPI001BA613F0|nr:AMP-binding protein [Bradyrhizobium sp. JYMT SZCCT0428]MBR1149458.1 AMP-binding protein [Bradyrhizobium sp. JYMT SZCCT0428]
MKMRRESNRPLSSVQTLMHMLSHAAERNPDGEALVIVGGVRLTYADLVTSVLEFTAHLKRLGSHRDRVAVALPNSADSVIAVLGAMDSGAQVVLLNPSYPAKELGPILRDADPLVLVCTRSLNEQLSNSEGAEIRGSVVIDEPFASLVRRSRFADFAALSKPGLDELAVLQYTGGTTGGAKGVNLTHRTTALNVTQREELLPTRFGQERFLCMTPLFHAYATATSFFPSIYSASTLVVLPRYEPERALDAISAERITLFCGAPTIYNGLVAHPGFTEKDYASLIGAYSGAAPLLVATLAEWERVTHVPIAEGYGLTEATAILCFNPLLGLRKPGSVGLALPGTEIEIVDAENGTTVLGPSSIGEIRARGPQLMAGYRGRARETAEIIRDGWLYTGDIGELDADGYLFVRDRKKDMAIVSGYNVFPRELDEVLSSHPDVVEAVAAAVPDTYRGEVMHACVKVRPGSSRDAADLIAYCSASLARYKVPAKIYVVEEISKTAAGKIDRKRTREWLITMMSD